MGRTNTSNTNPPQKFNDGNKFQISKTSSFQKVTGPGVRKLPRNEKNNRAYTVTRVSEDGVDDKGIIRYKREVILFENKEDLNAFNELGSVNKSQLGANGAGVVIATGSTDPSKKSFELTEAGAKIPYVKNNEEKIQRYSSNGVKDIIKDENYKVKAGLNNFSNNQRANNKDDAIDSKAAEDAAEKKQKALDKKLARGKYPKMFYPSHIANSVQDKLKISILKPLDANSDPSKKKKKKFGQGGLELGTTTYRAGGYESSMKKSNKTNRRGTAFNKTAAGENSNKEEFGKSIIGSIFLPIPDGVTDQNKVNFGEGKLNPLQKFATGAALEFFQGKVKKEESTGSVLKRKLKDPNTKRALENLIAGSATGVDTDELLARTQGSILNNNLALLFKGPTLRSFTFQFVLSPRDSGESEQVRQIIRALKQSSAAQRTRAGTFLGAPNTYALQFLNGLQPHGFLPRIKECALLSVGVNYMPENSYMTYEDTSMVSYSLSLSFQELESLYNDDYDSDNKTPVNKLEDSIFDTDFAGQAKSRGIGF